MKAQIKKINIELETYGERKGQYTAKITVGTEMATIIMEVSPEFTDAVLKQCAGEIINEINRGTHELSMDLALSAGIEIDDSAVSDDPGAFRLLTTNES